MKLVLFDIDGTLITRVSRKKRIGFPRFEYAIQKVYGLRVRFPDTAHYSGWVDKQIIRSIIPKSLFPKKEFDVRWPYMARALLSYAHKQEQAEGRLYGPIDDTVALARCLHADSRYITALLTGNVKTMANWKLRHANISRRLFTFGLFGDTADDRVSLARSVFGAVREHCRRRIRPEDITVIGDTPGDVRCGKAIGAGTIVVVPEGISTVGIHGRKQRKKDLELEHPDLLVSSLMDKSVLDYFGLKTV